LTWLNGGEGLVCDWGGTDCYLVRICYHMLCWPLTQGLRVLLLEFVSSAPSSLT
jgi:hypothetical protein